LGSRRVRVRQRERARRGFRNHGAEGRIVDLFQPLAELVG
jgi:hypothetical protein